MSQHDDTFKTPKHSKMQKLRTPQMRALRKELLLARADVERMELRQATYDLRASVTHFSFLRFLIPGGGSRRWGRRGASSGIAGMLGSLLGSGNVGALLKPYPIIGSVASLVLTRPVRTRLLRSAKPLLKWGGLALAGWEGWRIYQQMKSTATETSNDAVDPTVF
ncbi:DUF3318 domain-containing protein [Caballeronia ptereochthonis]|uniref:DUF3318 domain-containing protein n=1 Tax=Caballeronia ptereochthonis TaxID=1777144 RepID=A0A158DLI8_9BURK|nr:DUF3318 domain-containing protein [Caballeronia ptereochthonis]SAK95501.1 hypothetical protein AWB83_05606 [Caballeronia ptereochthonis]